MRKTWSFLGWRLLLELGNPSWRPEKNYTSAFDDNFFQLKIFLFLVIRNLDRHSWSGTGNGFGVTTKSGIRIRIQWIIIGSKRLLPMQWEKRLIMREERYRVSLPLPAIWGMGHDHRVLTPPPFSWRQVEIIWTCKITPLLPSGIGERLSQTISIKCQAALLCRCELPL